MTKNKKHFDRTFTHDDLSEIIQMALSDHVTFSEIETQYGLKEDQVKKIMRKKFFYFFLYKKRSHLMWKFECIK